MVVNDTIKSNRGRHTYRLTPRLIEELQESTKLCAYWSPKALVYAALQAVRDGVSAPVRLEVFDHTPGSLMFRVRFDNGHVHIGCRAFSRADSARLFKWAGVER